MRRSKFLRGGIVVGLIGAMVGLSAVAAFADIKLQTLSMSPTSTTAGVATPFTLSFLSHDGDKTTNPQSDQKPLCLVFDTSGGFGTFTNMSLSTSPTAVSGWTGSVGPGAGQFKFVAPSSSGPAIPGGSTVTVNVTATAPASGTFLWSVVGYDDTGCTSHPSTKLNAPTAVTVNPAPPPGKHPTQTTIVCDTGAPIVGTPDPCHVTVTDTDASPTALDTSVPVTVSLIAGTDGSLSGSTCATPTAGATGTETCNVTYTAASTGNKYLSANFPGDATHAESNGTATLGAIPPTPPAPPRAGRPDLLIKGNTRGAHWIGEGIFDGSGTRQRVHQFVRPGRTTTAWITVENDAKTRDIIVVGGRSHQAGFSATYTFSGRNISRQVAHHGYAFELAPGAQRVIKLKVHAFRTAARGKERTWQVIGRSTNNPLKRDTVKFTTTVR